MPSVAVLTVFTGTTPSITEVVVKSVHSSERGAMKQAEVLNAGALTWSAETPGGEIRRWRSVSPTIYVVSVRPAGVGLNDETGT
jgi:hypothetical protein